MALDDEEIIMLRRDRQEVQGVELRHRRDRDAPVGAVLVDRGRDRIVRFRLIGVTRRTAARQQPVDEDAGAGAGIAADHQA